MFQNPYASLMPQNQFYPQNMNMNNQQIMPQEQTQKILDAMAQNKIESLQAQVNQLQLQSAMCGVVRYPNATTYTSGVSPFWNQSCCNNGCNI